MTAGSRVARIRGFYGVVDLRPVHDDRDRELLLGGGMELARQLVNGSAAVVQLRMKGAPVRLLLDVAAAVQPIVRAAGALFIVNDRLDVALAVGADGVHLGQDDLPLDAARSAAAGQLLIGISTHSAAQAVAAARGGADYLGFGPVFVTSSKDNPDPVQGIDGLNAAAREVAAAVAGTGTNPPPIVAIGGITPERARQVASAGASAACVIAAVNGAPDVTSAARLVAAAFVRRA